MNLYQRDAVGTTGDLPDFLAYLQRELDKIQIAFGLCLPQQVEILHVAPLKVREGMIVGADGSDWDPGSGTGIYAYYSAAWHKLG